MTKNPSWIQFDNDMWGEAVGGTSDHDDWLRSLDSPELPASTLDPLPDVKAPLRQGWIAEQTKESVDEYRSRIVGPYGPTWAYRSGIEAEISRLSLACRESTGTEGEANLRLLRGAEAALREFDSTAEFHEAVRHALDVVDRTIKSAGSDLNPAQTIAKARYAAIRASLEAALPDTASQAHTPRNEIHLKPDRGVSKAGDNALSSSGPGDDRHGQSAATWQDQSRKQQTQAYDTPTRQDAMSLELEEVTEEMTRRGERVTAVTVMGVLRNSAGKGGCVIDIAGDGNGVVWERSNGNSETLNYRALDARLRRMRQVTR